MLTDRNVELPPTEYKIKISMTVNSSYECLPEMFGTYSLTTKLTGNV